MLNYEIYDSNKEEWTVLIHGIGGDISTWDNQIEDLKKNYNLLLIDLPWHGKSKISSFLTRELLSEEIKKVLDYNHIEKAHFVGLSLGSLAVSQFAIMFPEYTKKLAFVGSVIQLSLLYKIIIAIAQPLRYILPYSLIYKIAVSMILPKDKTSIDRTLFAKDFLKMGRLKVVQWIKYLSVTLDGEKVIKKLKSLNKDILFISGEYDSVFIKGAKQSAEILNQTLLVMKKCTHICNIDNINLFNKKLMDFLLAECPAGI